MSPRRPAKTAGRGPGERGSVLVLALLVTLIILAIGLTAMWLSSSGMKMSSNITRRQEALYAAETGLSHARQILKNTVRWSDLLLGCSGSHSVADDPTGKGMILCETGTGPALYQLSMLKDSTTTKVKARWMDNLQYTVYIRNDAAEVASGAAGLNDDKDRRVVIRAEGTGRDQLSFFAIEAVVSQASAMLEEENYSQLGGSAQNQNSGNAKVPLPPASTGP